MARQITNAYPTTWPLGTNVCSTHAALCNDGTLWVLNPVDKEWELVPNVPQTVLPTTSVGQSYNSAVTATPSAS